MRQWFLCLSTVPAYPQQVKLGQGANASEMYLIDKRYFPKIMKFSFMRMNDTYNLITDFVFPLVLRQMILYREKGFCQLMPLFAKMSFSVPIDPLTYSLLLFNKYSLF